MFGETIYHVALKSDKEGENDKHQYFGSITAICDVLTHEQIKVKLTTLWNFGITADKPYTNKYCTIRKGVIHRKQKKKHNAKRDGSK